jgi:uncharacterized protein (TIGR00297 family)
LPISFLDFIIGILIIIILGVIGYKTKSLDLSGILFSAIIGTLVLIGGGLHWLAVIIVFFIISALFTKFRYDYKKSLGTAQEKGGARSWQNTVANGGIASFFAIMELTFGGSIFAIAFLGAVSSTAADTLATELGLLSKTQPRLITDPRKRVPAGTSGGVTLLGFFAAFLAALLIGSTALVFGVTDALSSRIIIATIIGGVIGSTADSVIGSTVQRLFRCEVCGKNSEELFHCDKPTRKVRGVSFIENNAVNLISTGIGALSALGIFLLV